MSKFVPVIYYNDFQINDYSRVELKNSQDSELESKNQIYDETINQGLFYGEEGIIC